MPYMPPACMSHVELPTKDAAAAQEKYHKYNNKEDSKPQIRQTVGVENIQEAYRPIYICKKEIEPENSQKETCLIGTSIYAAKYNTYINETSACNEETGGCTSKNVYMNKNSKSDIKGGTYMAENITYMAGNNAYNNENNAYIGTYVSAYNEQVVAAPLGMWTTEWNSRAVNKQKSQQIQQMQSTEQQLMQPIQTHHAQHVLSPSLPISPACSSTCLSASSLNTFYERTEHSTGYSFIGSSYLRKISSNPSFPSISVLDNGKGVGESLREVAEPRMVRKKSGELVKSSLKGERQGRSQSVPSTPILHKNVQFATELEQIRHFSQAEKPTAVSADASPEEKDSCDMEFGYDLYEHQEGFQKTQWIEKGTYELEIELANFSEERTMSLSQNVHLESVYLSSNKRNLLGKVVVKNLAFEKSVGVRFTMDHWQTISEVNAEYTDDIPRKQYDGFDRFVFNIKLHELVNIEDKTLYLCIRYRILGAEFWDNNLGMNYRIEFRKKLKTSTQPHLTHYPILSSPNSNTENNINSNMDTHLATRRAYKSNSFSFSLENNDLTTTPPPLSRKKQSSNNLFSTRYDFSASLTAAIKASNNTIGYDNKNTNLETRYNDSFDISTKNVHSYFSNLFLIEKASSTTQCNISFENDTSDTPSLDNTKLDTSLEKSKTTSNLLKDNFKPSVDSVSYKNFLNNYCFFRGSDKINTQTANFKIHMNENPVCDFSSSHRKFVSPDSLSSESISFSSDTSLFYPHTPLSSISSDSVSSNMSRPSSESKTSIDLYYNHLINSSLGLEAPGSTLTAIRT
ncbi:uncharacterized protein T551_01478 [Pneumocystis jirovecii RU7]|uniref:CBM21 domain-containing protein n=1 Tax=Pneumocystis jirovecii (strain RU7) TaxID=1408657 RepID=A0A0W4ZRG4_PNEJ7|nr:uncharacterized protein T551_01478 [Pneumocystis jirovecii RU7]KTW30926.1 hypothetical protein T551_01478 [Pneumocystis jirovecii RU7]